MKRFFICGIVLAFLLARGFSLPSNSFNKGYSDRKTAVNYLKSAEIYFFSKNYEAAISQSALGLAYDDTVSDLWYINAASKNALGVAKAEILPFVVRALNDGEWVDYNRNLARSLYASILCDTGKYEEAISALDAEPTIYSADAEFTRTKSYYGIGDEKSLEAARKKIDDARKIYSTDTRFPRLFFEREYELLRAAAFSSAHFLGDYSDLKRQVVIREKLPPLALKLADAFVSKMPEYNSSDVDLEMYACLFAYGETQLRMLQAFASRGMTHPLYAHVALDRGLLNEQEAWDYFCVFFDKSISLADLEQMVSFVTDTVTLDSVKEHLAAFSGELLIDTNSDGENELRIQYERGRPISFSWDETNDGILEWSGKCDFGNPVEIKITDGNVLLTYGNYPEIVLAEYVFADDENRRVKFTIPDDSFYWSPCRIETVDIIKTLFDYDFFVLSPIFPKEEFDGAALLRFCSGYEMPSDEKEGANIKFSVLNGLPVFAEYFANGTRYAYAEFENGFPRARYVDNTGDGVYETTEFMGYDSTNAMNINSNEQNQVMTNIFGLPALGSGVYVREIQVDRNGDTVPDFIEEYLPDGGKITSWDFNDDGNWNLRYKKYPQLDSDDSVVDEAQFYLGPERVLTMITHYNGVPIKVETENQEFSVTKGESDSFYWIGEKGALEDEMYVLSHFDRNMRQGISVVLETDEKRMTVIKIGENVFSWIIPVDKRDVSIEDETIESETIEGEKN